MHLVTDTRGHHPQTLLQLSHQEGVRDTTFVSSEQLVPLWDPTAAPFTSSGSCGIDLTSLLLLHSLLLKHSPIMFVIAF